MEGVFLFCADAKTRPDGKLDIHGVFNELYAADFPARQDEMVLVGIVEWQRDLQGRIPFTVDLIDSDGLAIFSIEGTTLPRMLKMIELEMYGMMPRLKMPNDRKPPADSALNVPRMPLMPPSAPPCDSI